MLRKGAPGPKDMTSRLKHHLLAAALGFAITALVVAFDVNGRAGGPFVGLAELARQSAALAYDLRLRTFADGAPRSEQPILIVDLDEQSLAEVGRWPWPRDVVATLLRRLSDAGAAVVAFDVVFSEPERNPVDRILAIREDELGEALRARLQALAPTVDGDRILAATLADLDDMDVVLGAFLGQGTTAIGARPAPIASLDGSPTASILTFSSWTAPPAALIEHAGTGHVITVPDDLDGVIRRAPLVSRLGDTLVPSLAVELVRRFLLLEEIDVDLAQGPNGLETRALSLGTAVRVPLDRRGRVLVPYRGPARSFRYLPAADVLADRLPPEARASLRDALVLVGTSSIGLADLRSTPTDQVFPGVEIHATVVDGLLEAARRAGDAGAPPAFPRAPAYEAEFTALGLLATGIVLSLLMPALGPAWIVAIASALGSGWLALNANSWANEGLALPVVTPLLLLLALTLTYLLRGFLAEAETRRDLKGMFDQYVPPAHIERMMADGGHATLEGESRVMTVLFADLQGFTSLSENLTAPEVKQLLNEYFTPITAVILGRQGTIDKYVGDMIMAFWNAPLVDPRHREHALEAAFGMIAETQRLKSEFVARGLPPVDVGIGINTGLMNVGDMGSEFRRAYTVLGDAVNLGARIEGLTRRYGVRLLVGEQTRDEAPDWTFRFVDQVQVKGKTRPIRVYEPIGPAAEVDEETEARLLRWHGAYWKFCEQDFEGALADIEALAADAPSDRLYAWYRARIQALRISDPGPDWDPVTVMEEK